jgi:hypothetical protein
MRGEIINLTSVEQHLRLPFFPDADKLELYHFDVLIFQYKIELCNNNTICEPVKGENYLSCLKDCPSGSADDYCDKILDGSCDPDCVVRELDIDCTCGDGECQPRESYKTCPKDCLGPSTTTSLLWSYVERWLWLIALGMLVAGAYLFSRARISDCEISSSFFILSYIADRNSSFSTSCL